MFARLLVVFGVFAFSTVFRALQAKHQQTDESTGPNDQILGTLQLSPEASICQIMTQAGRQQRHYQQAGQQADAG